MRTFFVADRGNFFADGAVTVAFGVISFLMCAAVSAWLPAFGLLALGMLLSVVSVGSQVYEVRVHPDGIVEFCHRWTTVRIAAQEIWKIVVKETTDEDGDMYCRIGIRHGWRHIWFPCSSVEDEFLAEMGRLNPLITVQRPAQRWWG